MATAGALATPNQYERQSRQRLVEIRSLTFVATEADLNELVARMAPRLNAIRDLRLAVIPEGIRVSGTYQKLLGFPFLTLWQLSVSEGKVVARLTKLKAGPLSIGLVRGYLLDAIAGAATVLELRDDALVFDVNALLQEKGWPVQTNLTSIRCDYGTLTIQSG
jgi:hypothetical protein